MKREKTEPEKRNTTPHGIKEHKKIIIGKPTIRKQKEQLIIHKEQQNKHGTKNKTDHATKTKNGPYRETTKKTIHKKSKKQTACDDLLVQIPLVKTRL